MIINLAEWPNEKWKHCKHHNKKRVWKKCCSEAERGAMTAREQKTCNAQLWFIFFFKFLDAASEYMIYCTSLPTSWQKSPLNGTIHDGSERTCAGSWLTTKVLFTLHKAATACPMIQWSSQQKYTHKNTHTNCEVVTEVTLKWDYRRWIRRPCAEGRLAQNTKTLNYQSSQLTAVAWQDQTRTSGNLLV